MGKSTGFLEYNRTENEGLEPLERISTYEETYYAKKYNDFANPFADSLFHIFNF